MTECNLFGGPENLIDVATLLAATRNPPWLQILVNVHDYISAGLKGNVTRIPLDTDTPGTFNEYWSVAYVTIVPDYNVRPGRLVAF